jgi:hypothetical protein
MSAYGPKRTSLVALHMSAFGGKADMTLSGNSLSRSLLGLKRTCPLLTQADIAIALRNSRLRLKQRAARFLYEDG